MANMTKKEEGSQQQQLARRDPFWQMMRDPFQMFREFMQSPFVGRELAWNPSFEVRETDNAYVFKGDLPGVKRDDLEISLLEKRLLITGKRDSETEQDEGTLHTYERSYGSFQRAFMLPDNADLDKISTDLKDGVLTIAVPKKELKGQQARKIQIGTGQKS
jgi:HSP20 family protein